jgi:glutathione synthase/RimK-type ligase-like ATP-grasp enzyme
MANLGIFVNRQTVSNAEQLSALLRCRDAAEELGHEADFIFPTEIKRVLKSDGLFIRHNTDPMNMAFVAAKMASLHSIPVIDDPNSIRICADKVNMYYHLQKNDVPIPRTEFLSKKDVTADIGKMLFDRWGTPLVLKEPGTSFSARVEKAKDVPEFLKTGRRFIKMSDWIVAQEFIHSRYDWRIGVLDGQLLYACKYIIPPDTFKIQASVNGHLVYCQTESVPMERIPAAVLETGLKAARSIGNGLYGVDLKECEEKVYVIEVNDNPSLESGEDTCYPDIYERIVTKLLESN